MKGPQAQYTKELYKRFGLVATWTPGETVRLGDVGEMDGNVFRRVASLKDFGIAFAVRRGAGQENLVHTSESGVDLSFKAAGSPVVGGSALLVQKAGATIDFHKGAGVVFVAKDCTTDAIDDQLALGKELYRLYSLGRWDTRYSIVTELKKAASASVFISESAGGRVELVAENNLQLGTLSLADLSAGFSAGVMNGINTQIIAEEKLTPLFRVRQLKVGWLGSQTFENTRSFHDLDKLPPGFDIDENDVELVDFVPSFDE